MTSSSYFDVGDLITPPSDRHAPHRLQLPSRPSTSISRPSTPSHHHHHPASSLTSSPSSTRKPRSLFHVSRSRLFRGRSSRQTFLRSARRQLHRLVRDLTHYARRHPWKVLVLVVVPLLGSLPALLARLGVRVPAVIDRMIGLAARAANGDPVGAVAEAVRLAGGVEGPGKGASL